MFGAIGILVFSRLGGIAFDEWGPWAPFVLAGAYQGTLLILATIVRIVAPGQPAPKPFKKRVATASEVA
jgi:hypothetical protein